jgi:N-acetylglucosamine kinase-like BadF-type ATPase
LQTPAAIFAGHWKTMKSDDLVLGIDGGGSKTVAWLGVHPSQGGPTIVGRGRAGPANPQAVGFPAATDNLARAIGRAFEQAPVEVGPVAAAVLALAGSDRDENRRVFSDWAQKRRLAARFRIVHDALPVLAAGSPEGWGVALISGTGSLAYGRNRDGREARAGGWGFLFGDEGSGYSIAVAGLRAAAWAADGRGEPTRLLGVFLDHLQLTQPEQLVRAVYAIAYDRRAIAQLAEIVTQVAAAGDPVAQRILNDAAGELAKMVATVAARLEFPGGRFSLALAGGTLIAANGLRARLESRVASLGLAPQSITPVAEPVAGAVLLAREDARNR